MKIRWFATAMLSILLLTGCREMGERPFAETTFAQQPEQLGWLTTDPHTDTEIDYHVVCNYYFRAYEEFVAFYREFSTVNTAPIVMPRLDETMADEILYQFCGGVLAHSQVVKNEYDYPFPEQAFEFVGYGSASEGKIATWEEYDYAIIGMSLVLDDPLTSLQGVQVRPYTGEKTPSYLIEDSDIIHDRHYELVRDGEVLMIFTTRVLVSDREDLHEELAKQLLEAVVCLSE